jgi:hypothetical protein
MLKQLPTQQSTWVVCDEEVYGVKAPESYIELTARVKNVLVGGHSSSKSELFKNAKAVSIDPITLQ